MFFFFFFFFQAEDGIRDKLVTGVQTCALPICARRLPERAAAAPRRRSGKESFAHRGLPACGCGLRARQDTSRAPGPPRETRRRLPPRAFCVLRPTFLVEIVLCAVVGARYIVPLQKHG